MYRYFCHLAVSKEMFFILFKKLFWIKQVNSYKYSKIKKVNIENNIHDE